MLVKLAPRRAWLVLCLLLAVSVAKAQQRSISGKVTDANNQPAAGATVSVKGPTLATRSPSQMSVSNHRM
jgi:TonB-dependent starch-binding outer membrane protein SusC